MKNFILTVAVMLALLVQACTITTTKEKQPVFTTGTDSIAAALNRIAVCENFHLNGSDITTNGKEEAELEIDVINGKNIPADDAAMISLARAIALQVKQFLADKNAYKSYKVLFVHQAEVYGVTKSESRGRIFTNQELTEPATQAVKAI